MPSKTIDDVNRVVNDNLRRDLEKLESALNKINEDLIEYMQLQKSLEFLREHKPDGFKTKYEVGCNMFMDAKVEKIDPILINIGLDVFLEMNLDEAMKFLQTKIKILTKEADVVRDESLKVRTQIKILLMYLAEKESLGIANK